MKGATMPELTAERLRDIRLLPGGATDVDVLDVLDALDAARAELTLVRGVCHAAAQHFGTFDFCLPDEIASVSAVEMLRSVGNPNPTALMCGDCGALYGDEGFGGCRVAGVHMTLPARIQKALHAEKP